MSRKGSIFRQDESDWGAAGRHIVFKPTWKNWIHHINAPSFSIALQYSMKWSCACAYFYLEMCFKLQEHWINWQDPAAPQSNSSCLEIDHFGETATGSIKLGQHFYQIYLKSHFSKESSGTIRIRMHDLIFIWSTFGIWTLDYFSIFF